MGQMYRHEHCGARIRQRRQNIGSKRAQMPDTETEREREDEAKRARSGREQLDGRYLQITLKELQLLHVKLRNAGEGIIRSVHRRMGASSATSETAWRGTTLRIHQRTANSQARPNRPSKSGPMLPNSAPRPSLPLVGPALSVMPFRPRQCRCPGRRCPDPALPATVPSRHQPDILLAGPL